MDRAYSFLSHGSSTILKGIDSVNIKRFGLLRLLSMAFVAGMFLVPSVGCEKSNSVVEAASEEELNMTEAELSGMSEEEYEKEMNNL